MTERPAHLLRRFFELYESGGIDAVLPLVAPDAVLVVPPSLSAEPDVYEGREGVRRYFEGFEGVIDDVRFEMGDDRELAPDSVLAQLEVSGVGAATRIPVRLGAVLHTVVRDGAIVRMAAHPDLESAEATIDREVGLAADPEAERSA